MTDFTPGPWKAERPTPGFREPDADDFMIVAPNLLCPAIVWEFGREGEANARLIAAAPDLFKALTELIRALNLPDACPENPEAGAAFDASIAALAKASP